MLKISPARLQKTPAVRSRVSVQWPEGEGAGRLMLVSALTCTSDSQLPPPQRCPTLLIAPATEVEIPDRVKDIQDHRWSLSETKSGWGSEVWRVDTPLWEVLT